MILNSLSTALLEALYLKAELTGKSVETLIAEVLQQSVDSDDQLLAEVKRRREMVVYAVFAPNLGIYAMKIIGPAYDPTSFERSSRPRWLARCRRCDVHDGVMTTLSWQSLTIDADGQASLGPDEGPFEAQIDFNIVAQGPLLIK